MTIENESPVTEEKQSEVQEQPKEDKKPKGKSISAAEFEAIKAKADELERQLSKINEEKAIEEGRWQDLYQAEKERHTATTQKLEQLDSSFKKNVKVNAFKQAVGGLAKDSYVKHIELDKIKVDDEGNVDTSSLKSYAEEFRNQYPELLKNIEVPKMNAKAPNDGKLNTSLEGKTAKELLDLAKSTSLFTKGKGMV